MLTGLDDEDSVARAYEAGATDFRRCRTSGRCWHNASAICRARRTPVANSRSAARDWMRAQRIARLGSWEWNLEDDLVSASELCFTARWIVLGAMHRSAAREFLASVEPADGGPA